MVASGAALSSSALFRALVLSVGVPSHTSVSGDVSGGGPKPPASGPGTGILSSSAVIGGVVRPLKSGLRSTHAKNVTGASPSVPVTGPSSCAALG